MTSGTDFEEHRSHLFGVAYRMLGSRAEAEDAVQEAYLRWVSAQSEVEDRRAWLTTVVGHICLDVLRSARARREAYVGSWLPEPVVSRLPAGTVDPVDPVDAAVRRDQVSLALLVVLERLTPEQRVAFVLHDVFAVPFDAIAAVLGASVGSARQHASRARQAINAASTVARPSTLDDQRRVLAAFIAAADAGDLAGLARVLAPEVELVGDGGGLAPSIRRPLSGVEQVGRFVIGLFRQARHGHEIYAEVVLVNGDLGFVVDFDGSPFVIAPAVAYGRIVALYHVLNPEKLRDVPRPDRSTASWPPSGLPVEQPLRG